MRKIPKTNYLPQRDRFIIRLVQDGDGKRETIEKDIISDDEGVLSPYISGTKEYLMNLGMSHEDINHAVEAYRKDVIKAATRIEYDASRKKGVKEELTSVHYLFEAVDKFGEQTTREMVVKNMLNAEDLISRFDGWDVGGGFFVLAPTSVKKKLDEIVGYFSVTAQLDLMGLELTHSEQNTLLFDYAKK